MRLAEILFVWNVRGRLRFFRRLPDGKPAATFSARSISTLWRFSNTRSLPPCSAHDVGAGLGRIAVGLLRVLILPQPAFRAESHSTASPREVVVAHN
jgi:hypothetical protein